MFDKSVKPTGTPLVDGTTLTGHLLVYRLLTYVEDPRLSPEVGCFCVCLLFFCCCCFGTLNVRTFTFLCLPRTLTSEEVSSEVHSYVTSTVELMSDHPGTSSFGSIRAPVVVELTSEHSLGLALMSPSTCITSFCTLVRLSRLKFKYLWCLYTIRYKEIR